VGCVLMGKAGKEGRERKRRKREELGGWWRGTVGGCGEVVGGTSNGGWGGGSTECGVSSRRAERYIVLVTEYLPFMLADFGQSTVETKVP